MKRKHLVVGLIILLAGGLFLNFYEGSRVTQNNSVAIQEQTEREANKTPKRSISSISSEDLKRLRNSFPVKADVRAEVARDPHRTPESLIKFATNMGPLMQKAYKNNDDAGLMVKELRDCATDESIAKSARALCVSNVEKIAKTHPEMKKNADELRASVSPEVLEVLNKRDLFRKNSR
jgi:hypothetical protein